MITSLKKEQGLTQIKLTAREAIMFYPVRVYSPKGKLVKEITTKSLSKRYWDKFYEPLQKNLQINPQNGRRKTRKDFLEMALDEEFFSED